MIDLILTLPVIIKYKWSKCPHEEHIKQVDWMKSKTLFYVDYKNGFKYKDIMG
jgi:hypothetical protein